MVHEAFPPLSHPKKNIYIYVILENWVLEEAKKATFKDHFHKVPLDYVAAKSLSQSHHPTSSPNHHIYNFDEEWENAGISSSDAE